MPWLRSPSNPRIFAVGDAAASSGKPLTPVAVFEGKIAASNMLKDRQTEPDYTDVPIVVFIIPALARRGWGYSRKRRTRSAMLRSASPTPRAGSRSRGWVRPMPAPRSSPGRTYPRRVYVRAGRRRAHQRLLSGDQAGTDCGATESHACRLSNRGVGYRIDAVVSIRSLWSCGWMIAKSPASRLSTRRPFFVNDKKIVLL